MKKSGGVDQDLSSNDQANLRMILVQPCAFVLVYLYLLLGSRLLKAVCQRPDFLYVEKITIKGFTRFYFRYAAVS